MPNENDIQGCKQPPFAAAPGSARNAGQSREACILVAASAGNKRAAAALIRRTMRVCGLPVEYMSEREARSYGLTEARFSTRCTPEDFARWQQTACEVARNEGWNQVPTDAYQD